MNKKSTAQDKKLLHKIIIGILSKITNRFLGLFGALKVFDEKGLGTPMVLLLQKEVLLDRLNPS